MAGQTDFSGSIISGPPLVSDNTFPSAQASISLHTTPNPKSWAVCTGVLSRTFTAVIGGVPWVTLDGIGSGKTVEECDLLYLRSNAKMLVRITQKEGLSTIVSTIYVTGLQVIESPSTNPVTLVEVQGSTCTIEYLAQGLK